MWTWSKTKKEKHIKQQENMRQNVRQKCWKTAGRTQQMNKVKNNISQNMQVFVSHLFVIPAFSLFFFSKFSAILWETSVQKVRNKHNAPKKTKKREHVCKVHDFAHLLSLKNSFRARHPSKAASWSGKNEAFVQDISDWNIRNIDDSKGPIAMAPHVIMSLISRNPDIAGIPWFESGIISSDRGNH